MARQVLASVCITCLSIFVPSGYPQTPNLEPTIQRLGDADPTVRMKAAFELRNTKDSRAIESLIRALNDEEAVVRAMAVDSLGAINDPRAVDPVIAALRDKEVSVRVVAANALGPTKDPRAVGPLILALKDEDTVRLMASRALDEIGDARATDPLMSALKDGDLAIVAGAYRFFIRRGEAGTEPMLIEALKKHGNARLNQMMSLFYYLSGNSQLEEAASDFVKTQGGYFTEDLKKAGPGFGAPRWGSDRK